MKYVAIALLISSAYAYALDPVADSALQTSGGDNSSYGFLGNEKSEVKGFESFEGQCEKVRGPEVAFEESLISSKHRPEKLVNNLIAGRDRDFGKLYFYFLRSNPCLRGDLVFTMNVDRYGNVIDVTYRGTNKLIGSIGAEAAAIMRKIDFGPAPEDERFSYTMKFHP